MVVFLPLPLNVTIIIRSLPYWPLANAYRRAARGLVSPPGVLHLVASASAGENRQHQPYTVETGSHTIDQALLNEFST